jgi:tetratricopeptide (TPR) repeat protein
MKILILFFFIFCCSSVAPVMAQSPQQQIQQAITDLKKQIAEQEKAIADAKKNKEDEDTIKSMEDELKKLKQQLTMMEGASKSVSRIPTSMMNEAAVQVEAEDQILSSAIPAKKAALLNALPKDNLNKTQLQTFLNTLYDDLKKKISADKVASVQKIITQLENDAAKIATIGVAAWYNNSPAQSALLLTYAATKSQDANTLNNLGAVMNLCGHEEKAAPILNYVLTTHPDNSTVLNNLGQAYAGLGDKQTAMMYFGRCIRQSPNHPEANATAAKIEESNGNVDKAMEYTEASLRGAYSEERAEYYKKKKRGCKLNVLFNTQQFGKTQFFDPGSIKVPRNCRSWSESESVYPEQEAYFKLIDVNAEKFSHRAIQNQVTQQDILKMVNSPFKNAAQFKIETITDCYTERKGELLEQLNDKLQDLVKQQQVEQRKWEDDFDKELKACSPNDSKCPERVQYKYCKLREAMENKYFGLMADAGDKFIQNNYTEDVGYYNSMVYLKAISSGSDKVLAMECGVLAVHLLEQMKIYIVSQCNPASKPECEKLNPANSTNPNSPDFKDPQCPIGLKVKLNEALELNLSCSQFKIELGVGEGAVNVKFGYEKDFITRESTLSMGPSVDADIPGILDASASVKAFVKFDGNNQPIDAGLSGEAEAGVKIGNTSTVGTTSMTSAGFTMGINSGFNSSGKSPF